MNERERWLSELEKSFKVGSQEELQKKFQILKHEGIDFNSLVETDLSYGLDSFPDKTELVRFHSTSMAEDKAGGVVEFYSEQSEFGDQVIIRSPEQKLWAETGLLDVFAYLEHVDFNLEDASFKSLLTKYTPMINLTWVHNAGGNALHEISFALKILSQIEFTQKFKVLIAHDSQLFYQIAKLRAFRHLLESLQIQKKLASFELVSEPSKAMYSNYEESTNMLRNMAATTAAMMGGADFVVLDNHFHGDKELYNRQTRNTYHVLNEESNLLGVKDPAKGSRLIESLTDHLVQKGFESFLEIEAMNLKEGLTCISQACEKLSYQKQKLVETQRKVMVGVNNYANPQELRSQFQSFTESQMFPIRGPHRRLEQLRKKIENKEFRVSIVSFGDLKKSFARVNFAQNIFEVLGKEVKITNTQEVKLSLTDEDVVVICAADEDYEGQLAQIEIPANIPAFIASREVKIPGYRNLHLGMNLYDLFSELLGEEKKMEQGGEK